MDRAMEKFSGFTDDTFRFFWEIALKNEISFFEENRKRYEGVVKKPFLLLASELAPIMQSIDEDFQVRPSAVLSRIRKDTRYAPIDAPFRDHAYLTYRYPGKSVSESFVMYVDLLRESYGLGMGMYADNPKFMREVCSRILAGPEEFMSMVADAEKQQAFQLYGEEYKRPRYPDAPEELKPWVNKRRFYYYVSCNNLENTKSRAFVQELIQGLLALKPIYRFIMGLPNE